MLSKNFIVLNKTVLNIIIIFFSLLCILSSCTKKEMNDNTITFVLRAEDCTPCFHAYTMLMSYKNTGGEYNADYYMIGERKKEIASTVSKYNLSELIPEENWIVGDIAEFSKNKHGKKVMSFDGKESILFLYNT